MNYKEACMFLAKHYETIDKPRKILNDLKEAGYKPRGGSLKTSTLRAMHNQGLRALKETPNVKELPASSNTAIDAIKDMNYGMKVLLENVPKEIERLKHISHDISSLEVKTTKKIDALDELLYNVVSSTQTLVTAEVSGIKKSQQRIEANVRYLCVAVTCGLFLLGVILARVW